MPTKRTFLKSIGALFATMGISTMSKADSSIEDGFMHVVYFWLKNPEEEDDRQKFVKSLTSFLDEVAVIQYKFVGTPAATDRDVIDSSYTYSLVVITKDRKDQDTYQDHPSHQRFIAESSSLWEKVVVYDSLSI